MMEALIKGNKVAEMLGISKSTVYEWSRLGKLPCVVLSRGDGRAVRRWRRSDIEKFVTDGAMPDRGLR